VTLTTQLIATLFITTAMLGVGLQVGSGALRSVLEERGLFVRALVVNFVLVPALGLAIIRMVPMSDDIAKGFLLVAVAPGGVSALQFTGKAKGALLFAAALAFVLTVVSLFVSPWGASFLLGESVMSAVPYGKVLGVSLVLLLVPLLGGIAVRRKIPALAKKLAMPVVVIATLSFFVFVIVLMPERKHAIASIGRPVVFAMLAFIVVSMAIGWLMGGPDRDTRHVLATASSMRNAALCLVIANNAFPGSDVDAAVVAFSALMIPPNMLFALYSAIRSRRGHAGPRAGARGAGTGIAPPLTRES
jgi:BASS family bile acid:Na+ symporter